ncbi:MAG: hypothetical protein ACR2QV_01340 [Gammaproteobacteria bacterium]
MGDEISIWAEPKPGFKWPVAVTGHIHASADTLWKTISEHENLERCHPFVAKNPVISWPGPDSRDEVHYLSGWVFERRFLQWFEGIGYDLEIGERGGPQSFVSWRIFPGDENNSELRIAVYPHVLQNIPVAIRWLPHLARVRPLLTSYLDSVLMGIDWYITRGEPVPRNQFGSHQWFSAST